MVIEVEQALLGCVLDGYQDVPLLQRMITPADFDNPRHEQIWSAILDLHRQGQPIDRLTVREALCKIDRWWLKGAETLFDLRSAGVAQSAEWYAEQVREESINRLIASHGARMQQLATDSGLTAAERLAFARQWIDELDQDHRTTRSVSQWEAFEALMEDVERGGVPVVPSPWPKLNSIIGGVRDGEFWIVAARPSVGKSIFLENWGTYAAQQGVRTLLFSLEMSAKQITARTMAHLARVPLSSILNGTLNEAQYQAISGASTRLRNMSISDRRSMSPDDIRSEAWAVAQDAKRAGEKLGLVLVDYVGLVKAQRDRNTTRQQALGVVSRSLKILAGELECPVIAASQLNRAITAKGLDARPTMADIRESGDFEQDADGVILLHAVQEEDPNDGTIAETGEIEFIVDKDRNGAKGTTSVDRHGRYARFA